jgi:outer membrane protein assembly factor BamB
MHRELTFYPEIERARDLLYSEYTSQDRSIHVLLQDNSASRHHFLLSAYREIVSRYLSSSRIQSPVTFLVDLTARLDDLSRADHVAADDLQTMGLYVLLRGPDGGVLLASRDSDVFVHRSGETLSLSEMPSPAVERLGFGATVQGELFPHRLQDALVLFRLDSESFRGRDLVLGCSEQDRGTVVRALSDPLWLSGDRQRGSVKSAHLSRRVLAVRIDETLAVDPQRRNARSGARRASARLSLAWGGAALVVGIAGVLAWRVLVPGERGSAARERPARTPSSVSAREQPEPTAKAAVATAPRLAENWRRTFGHAVTSSPASREALLIFGCRDGSVYAVERDNGRTRWTVPLSGGVGASPVVHENSVVLADYSGTVVALSADDGSVRWRRKLPERIVSTASISGDRVALGCYDGRAYCLSLADGQVLWTRATGGMIRGSVAATGGVFYVASYDGYLYALSAENGDVRWRYRVGGNVSSSPFTRGDVVVVGSPDGSLHAVDAEKGSTRWTYMTNGPVKSSPIVENGLVYAGSNDKSVYCLNVSDGSMVWTYETGDIVLARPAVRGGTVYVGSYDGYLYCLDAGTGELLDRFKSEGEIYSSPLVDADAVYFGTNSGHFIALSHHARKTL